MNLSLIMVRYMEPQPAAVRRQLLRHPPVVGRCGCERAAWRMSRMEQLLRASSLSKSITIIFQITSSQSMFKAVRSVSTDVDVDGSEIASSL